MSTLAAEQRGAGTLWAYMCMLILLMMFRQFCPIDYGAVVQFEMGGTCAHGSCCTLHASDAQRVDRVPCRVSAGVQVRATGTGTLKVRPPYLSRAGGGNVMASLEECMQWCMHTGGNTATARLRVALSTTCSQVQAC